METSASFEARSAPSPYPASMKETQQRVALFADVSQPSPIATGFRFSAGGSSSGDGPD